MLKHLDRLRCRLISDRDFDLELRLGLSGTSKLLVDRRVVAIQLDVRGRAIGIALEKGTLIRWDAE